MIRDERNRALARALLELGVPQGQLQAALAEVGASDLAGHLARQGLSPALLAQAALLVDGGADVTLAPPPGGFGAAPGTSPPGTGGHPPPGTGPS